MGLIYSSSDSENLINGLRANIDSAKAALEDLVSASQQLTSFIGAGKALDGTAFNAGKDLFSALIIPTIHRASSAFDDTKRRLSQYESANGEVSGEGVLDEDKLNAKKASIQAIIAETDNAISTLAEMASAANAVSLPSVGPLLNEAVQSLENYSESLEQDLDKIENKLRKLHNFNSAVSGLFKDDLNNFKLVVQSVAVLKETVVDSKTGSYTLPKGIDESWFTNIIPEFVKKTTDLSDWSKEAIGSFLDETKDKIIKEGKNIGKSWGAKLQPRDSLGRFLKDDFELRRWLSGKLKGVSTPTSTAIGGVAKWGSRGLVALGAYDEFKEYNDKYHNTGRAITYGAVATGAGIAAGAIGSAIGGSIAVGFGAAATGAVATVLAPVVGAVVVGAAVSVGVKALYDHYKPFKNVVNDIGDKINDIGKAVSNPLKSLKGVFGC